MSRADKLTFFVSGLGCADCVAAIENAVLSLEGVGYVGVSLTLKTITVRPDSGFDLAAMIIRVHALGYGVHDVAVGDAINPGVCPCQPMATGRGRN